MTCSKCGFCVSMDAYREDMLTVKPAMVLKLMWNGDWDEERYMKICQKRGAYTVGELLDGWIENVPQSPGLYTLRMPAGFKLKVLEKNVGRQLTIDGRPSEYDPRDLELKIDTVYGNGAKYRTDIVYIGKTSERDGLQGRIKKYLGFRQNEKWGNHDGGRAAWQIKDSESLIVHYEVVESADPETVEKERLIKFKEKYDDYPLANWKKQIVYSVRSDR